MHVSKILYIPLLNTYNYYGSIKMKGKSTQDWKMIAYYVSDDLYVDYADLRSLDLSIQNKMRNISSEN